jgi:hypothetical protein
MIGAVEMLLDTDPNLNAQVKLTEKAETAPEVIHPILHSLKLQFHLP